MHSWGGNEKKRKILVGIVYGTLWSIWKSRNDLVFKSIKVSPDKIVGITKSLVYGWLRHRTGAGNLSWDKWCLFPF